MSTSPAPQDLLLCALREPVHLPRWPAAAWDILIRQARRADLLARIAIDLDRLGLLTAVPEAPRAHLRAALIYAEAQHLDVRREVRYLTQALQAAGATPVLLKGAAYVMDGRFAAAGRIFSDVDVLVPKSSLGEVEASLMQHGWATTHHSAYDQRYYRTWMHELPPMRHIRRLTVVDVHHAILPETARLKPSSALLLAAARPSATAPDVWVLAPADMVLHSMAHLFHNEELSHGLRDLCDLDLLLREFAVDDSFWRTLVERAAQLDLQRPLYYGLRYTRRVLGTPVPDLVVNQVAADAPASVPWMDLLWSRGLHPQHPSAARPFTGVALFMLYIRAHWLRMPPGLLTRHLLTKALRRNADPKPAA